MVTFYQEGSFPWEVGKPLPTGLFPNGSINIGVSGHADLQFMTSFLNKLDMAVPPEVQIQISNPTSNYMVESLPMPSVDEPNTMLVWVHDRPEGAMAGFLDLLEKFKPSSLA